ncbi:aldo/keto reductase [Listeria seeligeri]|uniref:Aldo/keto reductase n=1 Tax=Listeria seeligeri TaxID=1640 RepID=A0A7X0X0J2_LISSE|nr:aldo/keto reductase [Listeria seeligeri]MBC1485409.1 aldo/keto reductase [Listeria seeligeri]
MEEIIVQGNKNGQKLDIACSNLVMGAGDFLRVDNMDFASTLLDQYFAFGGNVFDTARHYRHSEKAIGAWMEMRGNRDNVIIQTKGGHPVREASDVPRVTPEAIYEDISVSLEMLKTDHVELFALHRDNPEVEVGPIMEALHKEVETGRVYAIGLSNWELPRIIEANEYAVTHGLTPLSFNSPNFSLAKVNRPRWENCVSANIEMIRWHEKTNLPLFSWSSQAGGFFSGRYTENDKTDTEMVEVYYSDANWERYKRAKELAQQKACTPIQISLAYVLTQSFPTAAVIGPENETELKSSVAAAGIHLTQSEVDWLDLKA